MRGAIAAEWLKLRSVGSTVWMLAVAAAAGVLALAAALYAVSVWDRLAPASRPELATTIAQALTVPVVQITAAVLGVLVVTAEYASGQIRASVAVVPRRGRLMAAKALVVAVATGVVATAAVGVATLGGRAVIGDRIASQPSLSRTIALVVATGGGVAAFALLGMALGLLLRSTPGPLVIIAVLWYPLPIIALHLPAPYGTWVSSLLPGNLPLEIAGHHVSGPPVGALSQAGAAAVLAAWALVPLAAAIAVFVRRDVR